jgi:DNA-binding transcriptional LysR family regulator
MMLDPRRLLTFREVARQRSFSRAGKLLSLTQPAVSQQIRSLEQQLGERLIRRGRPGEFALTRTGEVLLVHAEALASQLELAETQIAERIAAGRRRLRIGAFPSVLATLVPAAVADLRRQVEALEVSGVQGTTDELVAGVRDGRFHVGLCFQDSATARREHPGVRRHDLLEEPMVAALSSGHRLAGRRRLRLQELRADTWTAPSTEGLVRRACVAAGFEPHIAYLTADPLAIRALVAADLAVTLTPRLLAGHLHDIAVVSVAGEPARRAIYAVTPPGDSHPLVAPFLDSLRARAV